MLKITCAVDLHIHTTNSDGYDTPEEIIQLVKEAKKEADLGIISITDHNVITTLDKKTAFAARKTNIFVIPGVEICTNWGGEILHILGYNIRQDS